MSSERSEEFFWWGEAYSMQGKSKYFVPSEICVVDDSSMVADNAADKSRGHAVVSRNLRSDPVVTFLNPTFICKHQEHLDISTSAQPRSTKPIMMPTDINKNRFIGSQQPQLTIASHSKGYRKTKVGFDADQCMYLRINGIILTVSGNVTKTYEHLSRTYDRNSSSITDVLRTKSDYLINNAAPVKLSKSVDEVRGKMKKGHVGGAVSSYLQQDRLSDTKKKSLNAQVKVLDDSAAEKTEAVFSAQGGRQPSTSQNKKQQSLWKDLQMSLIRERPTKRQSLFEMIVPNHINTKYKDMAAQRKSIVTISEDLNLDEDETEATSVSEIIVDSFVSQQVIDQSQEKKYTLASGKLQPEKRCDSSLKESLDNSINLDKKRSESISGEKTDKTKRRSSIKASLGDITKLFKEKRDSISGEKTDKQRSSMKVNLHDSTKLNEKQESTSGEKTDKIKRRSAIKADLDDITKLFKEKQESISGEKTDKRRSSIFVNDGITYNEKIRETASVKELNKTLRPSSLKENDEKPNKVTNSMFTIVESSEEKENIKKENVVYDGKPGRERLNSITPPPSSLESSGSTGGSQSKMKDLKRRVSFMLHKTDSTGSESKKSDMKEQRNIISQSADLLPIRVGSEHRASESPVSGKNAEGTKNNNYLREKFDQAISGVQSVTYSRNGRSTRHNSNCTLAANNTFTDMWLLQCELRNATLEIETLRHENDSLKRDSKDMQKRLQISNQQTEDSYSYKEVYRWTLQPLIYFITAVFFGIITGKLLI